MIYLGLYNYLSVQSLENGADIWSLKMRSICFAILSTAALASTRYTTNDANDTSNVCGTTLLYNCTQANAWAVGPTNGDIRAVAETFTPAATGVVGQVDVPVAAISGTGALTVTPEPSSVIFAAMHCLFPDPRAAAALSPSVSQSGYA